MGEIDMLGRRDPQRSLFEVHAWPHRVPARRGIICPPSSVDCRLTWRRIWTVTAKPANCFLSALPLKSIPLRLFCHVAYNICTAHRHERRQCAGHTIANEEMKNVRVA
jgi:hypothetical protein